MPERVGHIFKEKRLLFGLTQEELAEGICSQAELSRIENGNISWSQAQKLLLIGERLGFKASEHIYEQSNYVKEVFRQIALAKYYKNYEQLFQIVKDEKKTPIAQRNPLMKQLLTWHEGICIFKIYNELDGALEKLHQALDITKTTEKFFSSKQCDIINSISLVYYDTMLFHKALDEIEKAFMSFTISPEFHDIKVVSKVYYNLSRIHTKIGNYDKSIKLCNRAIDYCSRNHSSYLVSEFLYQIGLNYKLLQFPRESLTYFNKALFYMEIRRDTRYISIINNKIKKVKAKYQI